MTEHRWTVSSSFRLVIGSLLAVLVLGGLRLPAPFTGDQALFTTAAEAFHDGAKLYRDIWDIKQPGIFLFYQAAGELFGFTEVGVHSLELLWQLAFACVLIVTLARLFEHRAALAVVPLMTVGFYYAVADDWSLTQIEALVGFPLYVGLWSAFRGSENGRRANLLWFLSGLMAGIVAVFKIVLVGIPCVLWLVALFRIAKVDVDRKKRIANALGFILLGVLLPVGSVILASAHDGTLSLLYWNAFVYPRLYLAESHQGTIGWLVRSLFWFFGTFGPLMALALLGAWTAIQRRKDAIIIYLLAWMAAGFAAIVIQRRSWWEYHFYLLLPPLGILAARGVDLWAPKFAQLSRSMGLRRPQWLAAGVVILLFGGVVEHLGMTSLLMGRFILHADLRAAHGYQKYVSSAYQGIIDDTAFLMAPEARPGPIVVLGDPLNLYLSKRKQAIASNGWSLEIYIASEWKRLTDELTSARPPYVFVANENHDVIEERGEGLRNVLSRYYRLERTAGAGVWYRVKE